MNLERPSHAQWSSRFAFLMAAIGSSVGLGNFWRFPYTAGANGGGVFVIFYLLCAFFIAYPLLMGEYAVGRRGGSSAVGSFENLAKTASASPKWALPGWLGMLTSFFILSFYCVVAGWVIAYIWPSFSGTFSGASPEKVESWFGALTGSPYKMMLYQTIFVGLTALIVGRGLKKGIELAAEILMPLFFLMLLGLLLYAAFTGAFAQAVSFLFKPDFSQFTLDGALKALGQAFFSVGVGVALMVTYGSYLKPDVNIPRAAAIVVGADTMVAIIAGLVIFPIVFAQGLDPAAGPGLFFVVLPSAFANMPFGSVLQGIFFVLALFAALTSSISLLEITVAWCEEKASVSRMSASLGLGFVLWLIGAGTLFSLNYLDFLDLVTGSFLLPVGGLLAALFVGWIMKTQDLEEELKGLPKPLLRFWIMTLRYVVPLCISVVLIVGLWEKLAPKPPVQEVQTEEVVVEEVQASETP